MRHFIPHNGLFFKKKNPTILSGSVSQNNWKKERKMPGVFSLFPLKEITQAKQNNEAGSLTTGREQSVQRTH